MWTRDQLAVTSGRTNHAGDTIFKPIARISITVIASFAIALSSVNLASAAPEPNDTLVNTVTNAVPDDSAPPSAALLIADAGTSSVAVSDKAKVTIPDSASSDLVVTQTAGVDAPALTIGLPKEAGIVADAKPSGKNALSYGGADTQTVVQPFADGLRLSTILENSDASTRYTYSLPSQVTPRLLADGSAILESTFGASDGTEAAMTVGYGTVGVPWAVDARGTSVATHYEVAEGQLVQVIATTDSTVFPVVADPTFWWGWNAFISNATHQKVLKLLMLGAAPFAIANIFVSYIPNAYVQLAVRLAGAMAIAGVALWNACNMNGRGVIVGQSWVLGVVAARFTVNGFFCLPQ